MAHYICACIAAAFSRIPLPVAALAFLRSYRTLPPPCEQLVAADAVDLQVPVVSKYILPILPLDMVLPMAAHEGAR